MKPLTIRKARFRCLSESSHWMEQGFACLSYSPGICRSGGNMRLKIIACTPCAFVILRGCSMQRESLLYSSVSSELKAGEEG